jgi:deoxyribonuclease V
MRPSLSHPWNLTPAQARDLQLELRSQVIEVDRFDPPRRVAGVDVGFEQQGSVTRAAVAVLSYPDLHLVDRAIARQPTRFPYVPGLLSFREIPAILDALERLQQEPDLLLCDGQGLAHPRRFGLACHLGLLCDLPSIGVAKSRLIGQHGELPEPKGSWVPLFDHNQTIGAVVRTRERVKPIYVSIGHRICLATAIHYVLACTTRYKLPETTRAAHHLASG